MEPVTLVEKNNKLKESLLEEKAEIEAILRKISLMVSEEVEGIEENLKILSRPGTDTGKRKTCPQTQRHKTCYK
jgi:methionine-rich copper-binding protein CopC